MRLSKDEQRNAMRAEIDDIIAMGKEATQLEESHEASDDVQRRKYDEMQQKLNM